MVSVWTLVAAVLASNGLWAFLSAVYNQRKTKDSAESKMLKGLGHDRICDLGAKYVDQGFVTKDEYENLHDYLYVPYKALGGNGTGDKIMQEVNRLPLREK